MTTSPLVILATVCCSFVFHQDFCLNILSLLTCRIFCCCPVLLDSLFLLDSATDNLENWTCIVQETKFLQWHGNPVAISRLLTLWLPLGMRGPASNATINSRRWKAQSWLKMWDKNHELIQGHFFGHFQSQSATPMPMLQIQLSKSMPWETRRQEKQLLIETRHWTETYGKAVITTALTRRQFLWCMRKVLLSPVSLTTLINLI